MKLYPHHFLYPLLALSLTCFLAPLIVFLSSCSLSCFKLSKLATFGLILKQGKVQLCVCDLCVCACLPPRSNSSRGGSEGDRDVLDWTTQLSIRSEISVENLWPGTFVSTLPITSSISLLVVIIISTQYHSTLCVCVCVCVCVWVGGFRAVVNQRKSCSNEILPTLQPIDWSMGKKKLHAS